MDFGGLGEPMADWLLAHQSVIYTETEKFLNCVGIRHFSVED